MRDRVRPAVALVTLGCGRNEVDTDQVTGALQVAGFRVVEDPGEADCVLVNTCTFIEPARAESIDTVLAATELRDGKMPVLVMGCMAEQLGDELAASLPEVAGVVGFADYGRLPELVANAVGAPSRQLLPMAPRPGLAPPTAGFPVRTEPRGPWAYLKIAGGCDRACTFCTIPSYRGSFGSRGADELVAEARWLAKRGVHELVCVSENTTSWGKDLPDGRAGQPGLVRALAAVDGIERIRFMYLQPDELTDELIAAIAETPEAAGYYDLSLQHASPRVVRAMARGGGAEAFLSLVERIRSHDPDAVFRSSFIIGFPGETEDDVEVLESFLAEAGLDWTGFFTYSPEEGTPSAVLPDRVDEAEARRRRDELLVTAELVAEQRTELFVGRRLTVLTEEHEGADTVGRSYREAPETDGEVRLVGCEVPIGRMVETEIIETSGVDLVARPMAATGWRMRLDG